MSFLLGAGRNIRRAWILLYDEFVDADGTTPPNHVPIINTAGNAYEDITAGATIEGNNLSDNSADRIVVNDVGQSNVVIQSRMTIQGGNFFGLSFRYQDSDHYFIAGCDIALDKVAVWINNAGFTEISGNGDGSRPFADGEVVDIEVRLSGSSIRVFINGILGADIINTNFPTASKHGFYVDGNAWGADGLFHHLRILRN